MESAVIKFNLTERDIKVLAYLVKGYTNKQISEKMFVSLSTVRNYVNTVCEKLQVKTRIKAAIKAVLLGIIEV